MKKFFAITLVLVIVFGLFTGCGNTKGEQTTSPPPQETETVENTEPVTLTIAGAWTDCAAIEAVGAMFTEKFPNCTVVYESVNDYYNNLPKRMDGEDVIDLFFASGLQASDTDSSVMIPYALDLNSAEGLDLSNTFAPLLENSLSRDDPSKLYSLPLGAEMRGMFVNKTLLKSVGIDKAPSNQAELLADCQILKDSGYIPMQGNPSNYGQWLIYPWVCSEIANAPDPDDAKDSVNRHDGAAVAKLLTPPLQLLYDLTANYYYDYKTAQNSLNLFNDSAEEDHARYFFNIVPDGDSFKVKDDSAGQIAFMPAPISYTNTMDKIKEDYGSDIEYEFIPAPVGEGGGYVYLSPAHGIAANKGSSNLEWSVKFLNYLFTPEINKVFAEQFHIMPNVKEAFSYISTLYDVPEDHICHIGQVTFDWGFYNTFKEVAIETSKANKPDTITENGGKMHEFDYYLKLLEDGVTTAE